MSRAGSVEQLFSPGVFGRFWAKVRVGREDECWEWKSCTDRAGYGRFTVVGGRRPKTRVASRVAYALSVKDPGSKHVLHRCDNPPCCNPAHLFLGTHADNMRDMGRKGRANPPKSKGADHPCAKVTEDEVYRIREMVDAGVFAVDIAKEYPLTLGAIGRIGRRQSWGHLPERPPSGERHRPRARAEGLHRGEGHNFAVLSEAQVLEIYRRAHAGEAHADIAKDYGITRGGVSSIKCGGNWAWLTGHKRKSHAVVAGRG